VVSVPPSRTSDELPWDQGGPLHTIYDVLRKLVEDSPWSEDDRRRAKALIAELQSFNVFGTIAEKLTMEEGNR
jgi:hypothetical protein